MTVNREAMDATSVAAPPDPAADQPQELPSAPPEKTPTLRRAFRRLIVAFGVLYVFGPHIMFIKLLGPRLGIRYVRLIAHCHWLLTWFGAQRRTARVLARVRPHLETSASVSTMLHRHLLLKHQSFAEWRLSVTPRGRKYIREVYSSLPDRLADMLQAFMAEGRGVMFVTYHFGMYKVLASAMVERYHVEVYKATYISAHYTRATLGPIARWAFVDAVRTDRASNTKNIYLRPDGPPIALVKRLRKGKLVGIAADGMISDEFEDVPFLGGLMRLPSGWAKLAAATDCAVIVLFASLDGAHRRVIEASDPFFVENTEAGIKEAVVRTTRMLEENVQRRPWDWHIWHRIEFEEQELGVSRMIARPMILDPQSYHFEKTPK